MKRLDLNEGTYAFVLAQVALLNCQVAGMQAENQHRLNCGHAIAYGVEAFDEVHAKYMNWIGVNELLEAAQS